jgi:WD40 repeat protein
MCVAVTPDGRMMATGSKDNTLRLWEVASGTERRRISAHESPVFSVDFSPDGRLLASASNDAPVCLWDTYSPQEPADAFMAREAAAGLKRLERQK